MKTIEVIRVNTQHEADIYKDILHGKSEYQFIVNILEAPNGFHVCASTYFEAKKKEMRGAAYFLIDKTFWT